MQVDQPNTGERLPAKLIAVAQQLISATHREDHAAPRGDRVQRFALHLREIQRAQLLVAILPTADVVETGAVRIKLVTEAALLHLELDPAPLAAPLEQQQVSAISADVHRVWRQRADAQRARRLMHAG